MPVGIFLGVHRLPPRLVHRQYLGARSATMDSTIDLSDEAKALDLSNIRYQLMYVFKSCGLGCPALASCVNAYRSLADGSKTPSQ